MKIARAELFPLPPRWLLLRLETDDGVVGWGEPIVEGRAATVAQATRELLEYVVGQDARRIEDTVQVLYRGGFYRGGPVLTSALSGIEQALWDIRARSLGVPVYELMGGRVRDRIRVYAWVGGDRPHDAVEEVQHRLEQGFRVVKMNATAEAGYLESSVLVRQVVDRVAAIREALGDQVDVALDFHGRVHKAMALRLLQALEPLSPLFVEEPVLPEHPTEMAELARHTSIPLATGERIYTRWGFRPVLEAGGVALLQPDVSHAGGIWETRKIAAMAEAYDVAVAPHCPLGPVALAAALQLDACTPNAVLQEMSLGIHYNREADLTDYVQDPSWLTPQDGYLPLPQGPGLGVELDEARIRAASGGALSWHNPIWRLADGSVAEW
jgi:galactonate dehydratase